jgi:hypothetical protein
MVCCEQSGRRSDLFDLVLQSKHSWERLVERRSAAAFCGRANPWTHDIVIETNRLLILAFP